MRLWKSIVTVAVFIVSTIVLISAGASVANAQIALPTDAKATCTVSAAMFSGWFESGTVTLNGVVKPADSVNFPNIPNCSFHQWSEQMFLWLTSPAPANYGGGGGRIFASPTFYGVSPRDQSTGSRTFLPHRKGRKGPGRLLAPPLIGFRGSPTGPNGLPVVFDKSGPMLEVERPQLGPRGRPLLRDVSGKNVELGRATLGKNDKLTLDKAGKSIRAIFNPSDNLVRKFTIDKKPVFINGLGAVVNVGQGEADGNVLMAQSAVVNVEQGEADGNVLMAQNGSLVYYSIDVNDVFAYFATGAKNGGITPAPTQFPTTQADLDKVIAFATLHGKTFPDPKALAIEVKSSWIETAGLDLSKYITTTATIPTYNMSSSIQWIPNGSKTVTLALVGMHVVGSTKGHPEMIWATFEHLSNSPNAAFSYTKTNNTTATVPQSTAGSWQFSASNAVAPFNSSHMNFTLPPKINAIATKTISPSNTIRWKAFGMPFGAASKSNTEVISINNSVIGRLISGDIRRNYMMTGSTWTIGGAAPTSANQAGTTLLANTTLETYDQGDNNKKNGTNCFGCHRTNTTDVSHIFNVLEPLFW